MSAISPHSKRERIRSSNVSISFGGLSDVKMICLPAEWRALNVWKNSSCVLSFPIINWISSIKSTSILRYFSRNFVIAVLLPFRMASISSLVKVSEETYKIFTSGLLDWIKCAMECIKCVLPSPTPPYKKSGL